MAKLAPFSVSHHRTSAFTVLSTILLLLVSCTTATQQNEHSLSNRTDPAIIEPLQRIPKSTEAYDGRVPSDKAARTYQQSSHPHSSHPKSHHSHPNELITEENVDEVQGLEDHQLAALDGGTHVYTNQFVVEAEGAPEEVKKLAHEHGYLYLGHVSCFKIKGNITAFLLTLCKSSPPLQLEFSQFA